VGRERWNFGIVVRSPDRRSGFFRSADHHQRHLSTILAIPGMTMTLGVPRRPLRTFARAAIDAAAIARPYGDVVWSILNRWPAIIGAYDDSYAFPY
jgi:hypothetical protein